MAAKATVAADQLASAILLFLVDGHGGQLFTGLRAGHTRHHKLERDVVEDAGGRVRYRTLGKVIVAQADEVGRCIGGFLV